MTSRNLLVELLVQELPPKALQKLGEAFAAVLGEQLLALGLASPASVVTPYASPRRLAAHVSAVAGRAPARAGRRVAGPGPGQHGVGGHALCLAAPPGRPGQRRGREGARPGGAAKADARRRGAAYPCPA